MKTSTILFLLGSVVIIGGGALAFNIVTKPTVDREVVAIQSADSPTVATDEMSGSASILDLMESASGKSMECTFVFSGEGMRSEGAGFFVDDKARVDSLYTADDGMQMASYMIMDNPADSVYVWSLVNGEQTGMKMSISENQKVANMGTLADASQTGTAPEQISPDSVTQYTCKPWSPDMTVFIPPSNVEFTDMTEMLKMMEGMPGMTLPPTR